MQNPLPSPFNIFSLLSLILLLPIISVAYNYALRPALDTLELSYTEYDVLDDPQDIGSENYERLGEDERYQDAQTYSRQIVWMRVAVMAVLPLVVGLLIGVQGWVLRGVNRLLLALIAVCLSPIGLAILWRLFLGRTWDFETFEPSPLEVSEDLALNSRTGAPVNLALLDMLITMGVGLAVFSLFYAAAVRGRLMQGSVRITVLGVWLISLLITAMSIVKTFVLPYLLTNGGPVNATTTLPLYIFRVGFQFLELGYASAMLWNTIVLHLILAFLVWLVMTGFNLRLRYTGYGEASTRGNLAGLISIPLILGSGFLAVLLVGWGLWLVQKHGGLDLAQDILDWDQNRANTLTVPLLIIWIVQVPLAYLTGLVLGYFRPLGRIGSSLVFLPLLMLAFLPTESLWIGWFEEAREMEWLDTDQILAYPWLLSALSLIVFKLFFDGAHGAYREAREAGRTAGEAFLMQVFLPSLPIAIVVGAALSFMATQEFAWSLVALRTQDELPLSVALVQLVAFGRGEGAVIGAAAVNYILMFAVPFFLIFALLHLLVIDRLALLADNPLTPKTDEEEPVVIQSQQPD